MGLHVFGSPVQKKLKRQRHLQLFLEDRGQKLTKGPKFGQKWLKFCHIKFSQHIEYDIFKEDHKNNFHTKKLGRFIAAFGKYR